MNLCHIILDRADTGRYTVSVLTSTGGEPQSYRNWFYETIIRARLAASMLGQIYSHDVRRFTVTHEDKINAVVM